MRPAGYVFAITAVIVLSAATLRSPFVAVAPVARTIGADLAVPAAVVGLLTSIPVLCFAVFAPLAIAIVRRGANLALTITLLGTIAGCFVRGLGGIVWALVGTAVLGIFLTIGNVVIPVIIKREFTAGRVHTMTGVYTSALNVGTMAVTVATAPLAAAIGWEWAILSWAVFAVAALAVWLPLRGRTAWTPEPGARPPAGVEVQPAWRHGPTVLLAAAFAGQAFAFYGVTAWLPTLLMDGGFSASAAGAVSGIFQVGGIVGGLGLPLVTVRASVLAGVVAVGVGWAALPLGLLLAPDLWLVWCTISGIAQGGGITVVFIMLNGLAADEHTAAGRSGVVQGVGYGVASAGPLLIGAMHEATGAWTLPLVVILAATVTFLVAGVLAAVRASPDRETASRGRD